MTEVEDVGVSAARRTGAAEASVAAVVGIVVALTSWFRMSPTTRGTIWAEDGRTFIGDALATAGPTLFRPYDGYLHLVPRLAGEAVTALVPVPSYALAMAALSCLVAAAVAALVYVLARDVVEARGVRAALALVTALVPALPVEVLGNMANIHWYFLWLTPWLLLHRPRGRRSAWFLAAVALVAALTEAQTVYFAPLLLWRWRDRAYWPVRIGLVVGLAAQTLAVLAAPRPERPGEVAEAGDLLAGFAANAVMTVWVGTGEAMAEALDRWGWTAALVPGAIVVACFLLLLVRGTATQRIFALAAAAGAILAWVVPMTVNRRGDLEFLRPDAAFESVPILRYAVVPSMLLLALVVVGLAVLAGRGVSYRVIALVVIAPVIAVAATNLRVEEEHRAGGPLWFAEVTTGREICASTETASVDLALAPPGWALTLPCATLAGDGG